MKKLIRFIICTTFIIYCFVLILILFLNRRMYLDNLTLIEYMKYSSNFSPFKTIGLYVHGITNGSMNFDIPIKNIFGNLLLFLPMGLYLPCIFKQIRTWGKFVICVLVIILAVEVLQLLLRRGIFDIDDLIMNLVGAIIGFGIFKINVVQKLLNNLIK